MHLYGSWTPACNVQTQMMSVVGLYCFGKYNSWTLFTKGDVKQLLAEEPIDEKGLYWLFLPWNTMHICLYQYIKTQHLGITGTDMLYRERIFVIGCAKHLRICKSWYFNLIRKLFDAQYNMRPCCSLKQCYCVISIN